MQLLRHKTSKDYFTVGISLIMTMQVFVVWHVDFGEWKLRKEACTKMARKMRNSLNGYSMIFGHSLSGQFSL